jgi:hypothetical protein
MRAKYSMTVEKGRVSRGEYGSAFGDRHGAFLLCCPLTGAGLTVIAAGGEAWRREGLSGEPWDHVSVSASGRVPAWDEMCWVKEQFFEDEEVVIQYHPAKSEYVNNHPHVLHLWKPCARAVPVPPVECV